MIPMRRAGRLLFGAAATALLLAGGPTAGRAVPDPTDPRDGDPGGVTVVFLVRHAEKDTVGQDPGLTPAGIARARALAALLAPAGVGGIYSTPYRRTLETARPLAERIGVPVETLFLDPKDIPAHAAATARLVTAAHRGGAALVVGHSNTVPDILRALGVADAPPIGDRAYGDLFQVILVPGAPPRLVRLRFGDAPDG